jgi:hypothetical protein
MSPPPNSVSPAIVDLTGVSWNRLTIWLRQLDHVRLGA